MKQYGFQTLNEVTIEQRERELERTRTVEKEKLFPLRNHLCAIEESIADWNGDTLDAGSPSKHISCIILFTHIYFGVHFTSLYSE